MKSKRNDRCPCGSGKKYKQCCEQQLQQNKISPYINTAHEWMDTHILHGRYPDLYGYLILVDHQLAAGEVWTQLARRARQYLECGQNRTAVFHQIIDDEISRQIKFDLQDGYNAPYCHEGCANCCFQPVACTDEEAQLINKYCAQNKIDINFDKLKRQLNFMEFDDEQNFTAIPKWDEQPLDDHSCIFLNPITKSCLIWPVRPFVCRTHLAEKTNEYCRAYNGVPDSRALGIHYPEISYILSAVFTIHHNSVGKMMANLLLDLHKGGYGTNLF